MKATETLDGNTRKGRTDGGAIRPASGRPEGMLVARGGPGAMGGGGGGGPWPGGPAGAP
jgi:hypothetical protein